MKPLEEIIKENKEADRTTDNKIKLSFVEIEASSDGVILLKYDGHEAKLIETVLINIIKLNVKSKYGTLKLFRANERLLNYLLRVKSHHANLTFDQETYIIEGDKDK
jgi:hypothetical protein